jgi:glycosyltransferase involved in cell wall biosynthesis
MQRLKIALVVHDLHEHGGHSAYTKVLAEGLSARHDVTVFANRCERGAEARWQSTHVWASRSSALACVQTFPIGLRAHSAELAGYDIRHMQGYCGGTPNVVTAHVCVSAYLDSLRSISLRNRASLKLMAAAERRFYRRYKGRVIAISNKIALELREFYQVPGEITVVPHGVDSGRIASAQHDKDRVKLRSEMGLKEEQTLALYVGDLTKAHVQLKALTRAAPGIRFVIITGSTVYHWTAPNVQILPPTAELQRYYAAADAFVFPTTYDAFGMVVLEAMAAGLPVFSSDRAGAAELMDSGKDGFVFPLDQWVDATLPHLDDRDSLRRIGDKAKQSAQAHGWESVVDAVEQVYSQTVDRH